MNFQVDQTLTDTEKNCAEARVSGVFAARRKSVKSPDGKCLCSMFFYLKSMMDEFPAMDTIVIWGREGGNI